MTRLIGLLELAFQISAAKTNGCDGGDCSCGEGEDCLATGWEAFAPQTPQPAQVRQERAMGRRKSSGRSRPTGKRSRAKQPAQSKQRIP